MPSPIRDILEPMEERDRLIARLREAGFKLTPQRLAVIELLEEGGHPTAEELYAKLARRYPMLSRATVYNTLEVLKALGEVAELRIEPQAARYDLKTEPHCHFRCRRCSRLFDLAAPPGLKDLAGKEFEGHRVEEAQLSLYGLCADCLKEEDRQ
ncbi:MAG: transcriptional repressor [Candidatus Acetothermia bacterium]|jgi:Fe2+ or Zn2+ uptake regulation protein|nr:transcriptional repressor [Candidatus Acetothermia bacterium]MDH7505265.1 transcriptional repressor [Candidatus Acetothermia bacterium]